MAVAFVTALLLLVLAAPSQAAFLHPPTAFSPIDGSGIGTSFEAPRGIAVDESTGNVFITSGRSDNVIDIMNSEGGIPVGVKSPYKITGFKFEVTHSNLAFDNSPASPNRGELYVSDVGNNVVKVFKLNAAAEAYEQVRELEPLDVAGPGGLALDAAGNLYVAWQVGGANGEGAIAKYSPGGSELWRYSSPAVGIDRHPTNIAVTAAGDRIFAGNDFRALTYTLNGSGEIEAGSAVALQVPQPSTMAIDPASNILYIGYSGGATVELDAGTLAEKGAFDAEGIETEDRSNQFAFNDTAKLMYMTFGFGIGPRGAVALQLEGATVPDVGMTAPTGVKATSLTVNGLVNPEGEAVSECKFLVSGEGGPQTVPCQGSLPADSAEHAVSAEVSGLSPNQRITVRLEVTTPSGTRTSSPHEATTNAIVTTGAATAIGAAGATLNGIVRPEGSPLSECFFEYGLSEDYGSTAPCEPGAGSIPADTDPHAVSANVSGLVVGTTYHYRIHANGGLGAESGDDATFSTLGPAVDSLYFWNLTETAVDLEAQVNPRGKSTTYHFEYGTEPCTLGSCTSVPADDATLGTGNADLLAAQSVKGLSPGTTYHFRIVVTNSDGTGTSAESVFRTYDVPPVFGSCPNDAFRLGEPSAKLPDCRAYEQATPVDKNGNDAGGGIFKVQASLSGDGITSLTKGGLPGAEGMQQYPVFLSSRGASAWTTKGLLVSPSFGQKANVAAWTPDLKYSFLEVAFGSSDANGTVDSAFLLRSNATGAVEQLTPYLDGATYELAGMSENGTKVFFEARGPQVNLTGNAATGKDNLYLWDRSSQELSLVGVLPNGTKPPGGSMAGPYDWWGSDNGLANGGALNTAPFSSNGYMTQELHAISADGSKAFFTAGVTGQLYLRRGLDTESPETVRVSASQRTTPDPNGEKPATFLGATPDGSKVFFSSCEKLTDDSTASSNLEVNCQAEGEGQDLYLYDTESGDLTDLTVDAGDPNGAEVKGLVGISDSGSDAYFVAAGDLDGLGGPAEAVNCAAYGQESGGRCNLYHWHGGSIDFVAKLNGRDDSSDWAPGGGEVLTTGHVAADGQSVVFLSTLPQTDYDLFADPIHRYDPKVCGAYESSVIACPQFYRYDAGEKSIACVACNPSGAPAVGPTSLASIEAGVTNFTHPVAKRFASANGRRVFFESANKLVGSDVNGDDGCPIVERPSFKVATCQDVYEWEAAGEGTCSEASSAYSTPNAGCIYLLSSGTSQDPSYLADASVSGEDVFIFTGDQLVPSDTDGQFDIYDVHVGGGLASQHETLAPPPPPCEGQACRGALSSPAGGASAGSASFSGPANPPIKRHKHKKHHKKHKKHHHNHKAGKRAGADQGGKK